MAEVKRSELLRVYGTEGTVFWGGRIGEPSFVSEILSDDYLREWTYETVTKMRRSDGMVAAILRAISLMIQGAEWEVQPASDDPRDMEVAAFVEENLWRVWDEFISQALLYLAYGFMLFEIIWEPGEWRSPNGHTRPVLQWKRFAPRMPWTIDKWITEGGVLKKVVQIAPDEKTAGWKMYEIPATKILRLTHDQEGNNFEGTSILRPGYRHWKIKDVLYKISAIKHERWGVGIPVGALPAEATDEMEERFIKALRELRTTEAAHLYLGRGVDINKCFTIMVPGGGQAGTSDLLDHIRHHDVLLARSILAEFLCLGDTAYGSRAVAETQMSLFLMALKGIADYIASVINRGHPGEAGGIRQLVDLNFGPDVPAPELVCTQISRRDTQALAEALARLVQAGAITVDRDVENWGRSLVGAPPLPEKAESEQPQGAENKQTQGVALSDTATPSATTSTPGVYWRELHDWEKHVDLAEYVERHADFERQFVEAWEDLLATQVRAVRDEFGSVMTREKLLRLQTMRLPGGAEFVDRVYKILTAAYAHGRESIYRELMAQLRARVEPTMRLAEEEWTAREVLRAQAISAGRHLEERIRHAMESIILTSLAQDEEVPFYEVEEKLTQLSRTQASLEAQATIRPAWGMGRNDGAKLFEDLVDYGYYSAILDENVCDICAMEDGRRVQKGERATPNPRCRGGPKCRCITIWILRSEVKPQDVAAAWYGGRQK